MHFPQYMRTYIYYLINLDIYKCVINHGMLSMRQRFDSADSNHYIDGKYGPCSINCPHRLNATQFTQNQTASRWESQLGWTYVCVESSLNFDIAH